MEGHDLGKLFAALPEELVVRTRQHFDRLREGASVRRTVRVVLDPAAGPEATPGEEWVASTHGGVDEVLAACADTFTDWRYMFEGDAAKKPFLDLPIDELAFASLAIYRAIRDLVDTSGWGEDPGEPHA